MPPKKTPLRAGTRRVLTDAGEEMDRRETLHIMPEGYDPHENLLEMEIPPPPEPVEVHRSGARLVITHIDVENFKSFHGRQTIGPLHKVVPSFPALSRRVIMDPLHFRTSRPSSGPMEVARAT